MSEHRQFGAGCTGCDWVSTDPRKSLPVAHAEHVASLGAPRVTISHAEESDHPVYAEQEPPTLADVDQRLLDLLRGAGNEWGPLGVLWVARALWPDAAAVEQHRADKKACPFGAGDHRPLIEQAKAEALGVGEDDVFGTTVLTVASAIESQVANTINGRVRVERCHSLAIARAALTALRDLKSGGPS